MQSYDILEKLTRSLEVAVRESLSGPPLSNGLTGYALCTDDGIETVYATALLMEAVDDEMLFAPTNWHYEVPDVVFSEPYAILSGLFPRDDFRQRIDYGFECFVLSLERLRHQGVFSGDIFLSVLSTDPCDYLLELETRSIARLNRSDIVTRRKSWR